MNFATPHIPSAEAGCDCGGEGRLRRGRGRLRGWLGLRGRGQHPISHPAPGHPARANASSEASLAASLPNADFSSASSSSPEITSRAAETILVVDDHPELCAIAGLLLRRKGYGVLTATEVAEAKHIVRQNPGIDLLLTDVEMPGMTGDELAAWFRAARPGAAVVYMSGNPMHERRLEPCLFVGKPFIHLDVLLQTIRAGLEARPISANHHSSVAA